MERFSINSLQVMICFIEWSPILESDKCFSRKDKNSICKKYKTILKESDINIKPDNSILKNDKS